MNVKAVGIRASASMHASMVKIVGSNLTIIGKQWRACNMNIHIDLIHTIVFGVIILGILTYSYMIFVTPINDAYIKLLQKYYPELFVKSTDASTVPQTIIVFNGTAPTDWTYPKGVSDINHTVVGGGM